MASGNTQQVVPSTIITIHGEAVPVTIRPHRVDTRLCPTTKDADWCQRVTHEVTTTDLGQICRGTYDECVQFVMDRQSTEATLKIAMDLFGRTL
jgi:hypothetical protein